MRAPPAGPPTEPADPGPEQPGALTGWLIVACRTPYAAEVAEIVWRCGWPVAALVDNLPDGPEPQDDLGPVVTPGLLTPAHHALPAAIPLLTPGFRSLVHGEAAGWGLSSFPSLSDPTAVVARTAVLGEGTVVNAASVIGARSRLGRFVHVNRSASVGHDADIGEFVTLGPACVLAGSVRVERGAFVGAGATVGPQRCIGSNAVVGAGAVVVDDVPANTVVVGNPARVIREAVAGYQDVGVPGS